MIPRTLAASRPRLSCRVYVLGMMWRVAYAVCALGYVDGVMLGRVTRPGCGGTRVCVHRSAANRACVSAREHVVGRHIGAEGCELSRVGVLARARWLPAILSSPPPLICSSLRGKYLLPCAACAREQHVGCLSGFCCCVERRWCAICGSALSFVRGSSCPAQRLLE